MNQELVFSLISIIIYFKRHVKDAHLHLKQILILNDHWILTHTSNVGEYWANVQCLMLHQPNVNIGWPINTHLRLNLMWALGIHLMFIYALSEDKYQVTTWYPVASKVKLSIEWPPNSNLKLQLKWKWLLNDQLMFTCNSRESEYRRPLDLHLHLKWVWVLGSHLKLTYSWNGGEYRMVVWFSYFFEVHMSIGQPFGVHLHVKWWWGLGDCSSFIFIWGAYKHWTTVQSHLS